MPRADHFFAYRISRSVFTPTLSCCPLRGAICQKKKSNLTFNCFYCKYQIEKAFAIFMSQNDLIYTLHFIIVKSLRVESSDGLGMEKVAFGRVRVYPNFQMSGSGMSGIESSRVRAGNFGLGYTRTHHYFQ